MLGIIYKATNRENGKSYIGQTIKSLNIRKNGHIRNSTVYNLNNHFHNALRKYKPENFIWSVLESCSREELDKREIYWIHKYNTCYKGYNSTTGGDINPMFFPEIKKKLQGENHPMYGKHHTDKSKKNMSINTQGENHPMYGKHLSKKTKDKIRTSRCKNNLWIIKSPGNKVFRVLSLNEFCRKNNLITGCMSRVAKGELKQHKGYVVEKKYEEKL